MAKLKNAIKEYIPIEVRFLFILTLVSAAVHVTAIASTEFADFYSRYVGCYLRAVLSYITVLLPFSLAEAIFMMLPVLFIFLSIYSFNIKTDVRRRSNRLIFRMLGIIMALYCIFVFGFGTGYYGSTIDRKLGIERCNVTAEELSETANYLEEKIEAEVPNITFGVSGSSYSPYSVHETSDRINDAYASIYDKYTFISPLWSRIKPIILSEPMTYTHIAGVYSYFTGEANVNTNFPDYSIPYTIAHELAHQRGIAREDEANFVAFLASTASEDSYIRYSGYLNLYEYVINALYSADKDLYYDTVADLDVRVKNEINAYNRFFEKYRENVAADVSDKINDTYLKLQGTEGSRSYGLVVDLAVASYKAGILGEN